MKGNHSDLIKIILLQLGAACVYALGMAILLLILRGLRLI
jgi:hypothetical protein